jgi:hypothetical protein
MRSLASDSHVAAMFRSICRCSGDLDWFAKPRHSLACCRYSETLRIPLRLLLKPVKRIDDAGRSKFAGIIHLGKMKVQWQVTRPEGARRLNRYQQKAARPMRRWGFRFLVEPHLTATVSGMGGLKTKPPAA